MLAAQFGLGWKTHTLPDGHHARLGAEGVDYRSDEDHYGLRIPVFDARLEKGEKRIAIAHDKMIRNETPAPKRRGGGCESVPRFLEPSFAR